jgi:hypothetical protein
MATLPYSPSPSGAPPTPKQPTIALNVRPARARGPPRTDFAPLAQKYREEILEGLKPPLNKLMELKKELLTSGGDPKLFETYTFIVDNVRIAFKEGNSEGFDYIPAIPEPKPGGRRRKTRRSKVNV